MNTAIITFILPFLAATVSAKPVVVAKPPPVITTPQPAVLAEKQISLEDRYAVPSVNEVFKDNILLNIAYISGTVENSKKINWDEIRMPSEHELLLYPNGVFAFHEDV